LKSLEKPAKGSRKALKALQGIARHCKTLRGIANGQKTKIFRIRPGPPIKAGLVFSMKIGEKKGEREFSSPKAHSECLSKASLGAKYIIPSAMGGPYDADQ
jgi:hypothetical protein